MICISVLEKILKKIEKIGYQAPCVTTAQGSISQAACDCGAEKGLTSATLRGLGNGSFKYVIKSGKNI